MIYLYYGAYSSWIIKDNTFHNIFKKYSNEIYVLNGTPVSKNGKFIKERTAILL